MKQALGLDRLAIFDATACVTSESNPRAELNGSVLKCGKVYRMHLYTLRFSASPCKTHEEFAENARALAEYINTDRMNEAF